MEFDSQEEAYRFYNHYVGRLVFIVRKNSTYRSRINNDIPGRTFCCSLEGSRGSNTKNVSDTRTGCKAMMAIWKNKVGEKWVVTQVVEAHNHTLVTPSKRYLLRSQQKLEPNQKKIAEDMRSVGIRTSVMVDLLASEARGVQNVGFTRKDANNYLNANRQKELAVGDAQALLDHLQKQQLDNPSFSYSIQVDSEGRMTNFFVGADARSRIDYQYFGDVVCFDPTYRTNKYDMPFVPIVGVNHHSQTVLFGGALLHSETEESFAWVMRTWMNAMNEKQPKVILTDQELAIGGAVAQVLPDCRHRYCLWHIARNGIKNLAHEINTQKGIWKDFNDCLYDYETIEEFGNGWNQMLEKYKLVENKWLKTLFEKREKWASVYVRDIFCAGMYTTQRSESINSYFDKYLSRGLPLFEFMKQYERAVVDRPEEENKADLIHIIAGQF